MVTTCSRTFGAPPLRISTACFMPNFNCAAPASLASRRSYSGGELIVHFRDLYLSVRVPERTLVVEVKQLPHVRGVERAQGSAVVLHEQRDFLLRMLFGADRRRGGLVRRRRRATVGIGPCGIVVTVGGAGFGFAGGVPTGGRWGRTSWRRHRRGDWQPQGHG